MIGYILTNKLIMSKCSPWSQGRHTPSGRKTYKVLSVQQGNGNVADTRKKRHLPRNKTKEDIPYIIIKKLHVAAGTQEYRGTIEWRTAADIIAKRRKRNQNKKPNARERQHGIRPDNTSSRHLWLLIEYGANPTEHVCFGLSSPWFFPSRSGVLLHALVLL